MNALQSAYETFKRLGGKAASFVQNNPTPAGYVSKVVAPTVNQLASSFQSSARQSLPVTDVGRRFVSSIQPAVRQLATKAMTTPILPWTKSFTLGGLTPTNLLTRQPGVFGALDPGSLYGAFSQARTPGERMALSQESALDMITPVAGVTRAAKVASVANPQALQRLRNLLTYQDDMRRIGYGIPGSRPIPDVLTSQKILAGSLPQYYNKENINRALLAEAGTEGTSWFTKMFRPIKGLTPNLQEAVKQHASAVNVAKINADEVARTFKNTLNPQLEWKLVQYSQEPSLQMAKKLGLSIQEITQGTGLINQSRRFNDEIFAKAKALGVDVGYLRNHIYQIFKESPDKVDDILQAKGLGGKPGFAHHRTIPNFTTAQELGLTPKFTTFAQLNAAANEALDKAIANQGLAKILEKSGQLLPQMQAPANWEKITARWFPKATVKVGKFNTIQQDWHAPRQLATFLNNYFGGQAKSVVDKIVKGTADVFGGIQNVALSGGLGPANWFGIGQMFKEGSMGRFIAPAKAFLRAFSPGASARFQANNVGLIREMAQNGIYMRELETYQRMYRNVVSHPGISEEVKNLWHKVVDEPTFGRFLKELQISFYQDTKNALIKSGLSERLAISQAAEATKLFYGIGENLGRAQGVDNLLTVVFMAPRYREAMVTIFANIGKALLPGNWSKPVYNGMRKLTAGLAITYAMYNVAQLRLTGNFLWQNPPGKEFELVIPVGDPKDRKFISIPFGPGFTAVPRRIIGTIWAASKGDPAEAVRQFSGLFSIPLSAAGEIAANKDFYGSEIYEPAGERKINLFGKGEVSYQGNEVTDTLLYGVEKLAPGPIRAGVDYLTGKSTPAFALVQALELPIRKGTFPNGYWQAMENVKKTLTSQEREQFDFLQTSDKKGGPTAEFEAQILLGNDKILNAKKTVMLATESDNPLWSRSTADIKGYLAYQLAKTLSGDTQTQVQAQLRVAFPWIPQVQYQLATRRHESYLKQTTSTPGFDPNSLQGQIGALLNPPKPYTGEVIEQPVAYPMQQLTPEQVAIASAYTAAPKGSAQRRQISAQNPWLKTYWDANRAYYDNNPYEIRGPLGDILAQLNISPLDTYAGGGYAGGGTKGKKITARKVKLVKIRKPKALKVPKLTLARLLPLRVTKTRSMGGVKLPKAKQVQSVTSAIRKLNALAQARGSMFPKFRV